MLCGRPILDAATSVQPAVPIFTLNYDRTFEKLAIEGMDRYQLVDGFELLGGEWDATRFADMAPTLSKTNIALFKLHGSTNWLPGGPTKSLGHFAPQPESDDRDQPPHPFEMVYPDHAHEKWFGDEYWGRLNDSEGNWSGREPYRTLHAHLHEVASRVELIVVIGYAFHDEHVHREILEAVNANDRTMVLVVDPGVRGLAPGQQPPFDFLKLGPLETHWSRFYWLSGRFGERRTTKELIKAISGAMAGGR